MRSASHNTARHSTGAPRRTDMWASMWSKFHNRHDMAPCHMHGGYGHGYARWRRLSPPPRSLSLPSSTPLSSDPAFSITRLPPCHSHVSNGLSEYGPCMACVWSVYGLRMVRVWPAYGLRMVMPRLLDPLTRPLIHPPTLKLTHSHRSTFLRHMHRIPHAWALLLTGALTWALKRTLTRALTWHVGFPPNPHPSPSQTTPYATMHSLRPWSRGFKRVKVQR